MSKYSEFYILLKKTGQSKESIISDFTLGRTESLRELTDKEYNGLCASLRKITSGIPDKRINNPQGDKLRKAIISIFHLMKYESPVPAAKSWTEKMGVGKGSNNIKRKFNEYTNQELKVLLLKAEKALADQKAAIRKRINDA